MSTETWCETVSAPRMGNLGAIIEDVARDQKCDCRIAVVRRGWFRETIRIECTGDPWRLRNLRKAFYDTIVGYRSIRIEGA